MAYLPPGVSSQRPLVTSSLENPSSVTTNPTPWPWSLKMEPALTGRLAALPFVSRLGLSLRKTSLNSRQGCGLEAELGQEGPQGDSLHPREQLVQGWPMCLCEPHPICPTLSPSSQIRLLDLSTGAVLWTLALPGLPGYPPSASLLTADHRSAFFFWGLHELVGANQMVRAEYIIGTRPCQKPGPETRGLS